MMLGLAFQFEFIDLPIGELWEATLQKAVTSGGIAVILLTLALELTGSRRRRLQVMLDVEELPRINRFLADFSNRRGWNERMTDRLQAAAEEALLVLPGPAGRRPPAGAAPDCIRFRPGSGTGIHHRPQRHR